MFQKREDKSLTRQGQHSVKPKKIPLPSVEGNGKAPLKTGLPAGLLAC